MNNEFRGNLDFEGTKRHILAGNSILTFRNSKTNNHLTFKVKKHKDKKLWFVSYLAGSDNTNDFRYLGIIDKDFKTKKFHFHLTKKSACGKDATVYKGFKVIYNWLSENAGFPEDLEVYHEGVCGRCGRRLTVPESIESGFGPVCSTKIKG